MFFYYDISFILKKFFFWAKIFGSVALKARHKLKAYEHYLISRGFTQNLFYYKRLYTSMINAISQ